MLKLMRLPGVIVAVVILGVLGGFTMRFPALGQETVSTQAKLTALREKHRDVLKKRVQAIEELFNVARSPFAAVIAAREDLFQAEYELATSKAQRVDAVKKRFDNAKEYESIMKRQRNDAKCSEADVLTATARRLGIEIELLREQDSAE